MTCFFLASEARARGHQEDKAAKDFASWWKKTTKGTATVERTTFDHQPIMNLQKHREALLRKVSHLATNKTTSAKLFYGGKI